MRRPEDAVTGGGALQEATERIRRLQGASSTLVVIPPNEPLIQGIHDPVQAFEILHATHALQTALRREGDQWSVRGAILDLGPRYRWVGFRHLYKRQIDQPAGRSRGRRFRRTAACAASAAPRR